MWLVAISSSRYEIWAVRWNLSHHDGRPRSSAFYFWNFKTGGDRCCLSCSASRLSKSLPAARRWMSFLAVRSRSHLGRSIGIFYNGRLLLIHTPFFIYNLIIIFEMTLLHPPVIDHFLSYFFSYIKFNNSWISYQNYLSVTAYYYRIRY